MIILEYLDLLRSNDVDGLQKYLTKNNCNQVIHGESLLSWAVRMGNVEFTNILIDKGADVNKMDSMGSTPLSTSCYFDFTSISRLLLENGAQIDASCLDRAYWGWENNVQVETLKLLERFGWVNLFLDDLRPTPVGFVGVKTIEQAIRIIEQYKVHILSLDHDLGMDEESNLCKTGYDLVKYICEKGLRADRVYLHTDNVVGRDNMYKTFLAAKRRGFIDSDIEIYYYPITQNTYFE